MYKLEHDESFIQRINKIFAKCSKSDGVDIKGQKTHLKFGIEKAPFKEIPLKFKHIIEKIDNLEKNTVAIFYLERTDINKIVSLITLYIIINDEIIYYGLHSITMDEYENKGYNQILRALFIMSIKYTKYDDKKINFIGSCASNPISAYIWKEKFKLNSFEKPVKKLTCDKIKEITGTIHVKIKYPKTDGDHSARLLFEKYIDSLGILYEKDKLYEDSPDQIINNLTEDELGKIGLVQFKDWRYYYKCNDETTFNFISPVNDEIWYNAIQVLDTILSSKIGTCDKGYVSKIMNEKF